jgi:hypothetical protein
MVVWGLQTYKKDTYQLQAENHRRFRKYVSLTRVWVWSAARTSELPHIQFVRSSSAMLKAILKRYFRRVGTDATRFINQLWKSISGSESVEAFLGEHKSSPVYARIVECFHKLEHVGDFLLAGRCLHDAFDTYSCLIYIRMILMARKYFLEEVSLVGLVMKCGRSAISEEQKKLSFELLESCLLNQSITGVLKDTVSASLRQYYTDKNPSRYCHIEPHIGNCPEDILSKLYSIILPTCIDTYRSMSPSWVVTKHSELYLPMQHAIYAHLWRNLHFDFPLWLEFGDTDILEPNLQLCEILATSSHLLAQYMPEGNAGRLFSNTEASSSIPIRETLSRLFQNEVCSVDILHKLSPTTTLEEVCFLDSLQARYQVDSCIHAQCMQWLQEHALASLDSCHSLSITQDLPLGVVLHKDKDKDSTAALNDETEVMEIGMTESSPSGAPQSSFIHEPPSAISQSIYLCSSSIQSSMHSMLSMASRIKRNARESALLSLSQLSSNSMVMSISGSFDFSRVTGMGSASLADHSIDVMEVDEAFTAEEYMDVGVFPY